MLPLTEARAIAAAKSVDLVEVAPTANPPVCKLMDFGRYKYEQTKKEREARKHQKNVEMKEVWFRPKIDDHDRLTKTKTIQKLLEEGDKVKVTVRFRGRELAHPELARTLLDHVATDLKGIATIERPPVFEGRAMTMIVSHPNRKEELPQRRASGG